MYREFLGLAGSSVTLSHLDVPNRKVGEVHEGMHAMVLVGHRRSDGKDVYLLQNWWEQKQFVEVSAAYLKASRATVTFVETPQTAIPEEYAVTFAKFAETEVYLDKPDAYSLEEYAHSDA
jgi:hypothetical protein